MARSRMVPTTMGRQLMVLSEVTVDNGATKANSLGEISVLGEAPTPKTKRGTEPEARAKARARATTKAKGTQEDKPRVTAAGPGQELPPLSAKKLNAKNAVFRPVGKKIVHLAFSMSRVSVPKVMLATIGTHLSADSVRRVPAQLVRNAASYIQQEKVQQHPHQSRKATKMKIKRERGKMPIRKKAKQSFKAEYFSEFLRLRIPALLPSDLRLCASVSFLRGSRSRTRSFQLT